MENPFAATLLNDFIFCPASIYFHMVDADINKLSYESKEQQEGSVLHENPDRQQYSTRKDILKTAKNCLIILWQILITNF